LYTGPIVHAATTYALTPLPFITQEGYTVTLILSVSGALPSTLYQFNFSVRDPSTKVWSSHLQNYTTFPGQTQFPIVVQYPSASFIGSGRNSLVGQYVAWVNQVQPILIPPATNPVAVTPNGFYFILTDKTEYQRTETVGIRATGYNASETTTVLIRTQTSSTIVLNATTAASSAGVVTGSWKIPRSATIDNYLITVTGKTTAKSPADAHGFLVRAATMLISALTPTKTSYQRTETMKFSFKPSYPDGQYANTGTALVILTSPSRSNVTLTAVYNSVSQTFDAIYKTFRTNQTGTWTASMGVNGFDDGFGNTGPSSTATASPQLQPAALTITITSKPYFAIAEQIRFNATIQYPDLTTLQSGQVGAFLLFSGGDHNDTIPVVFDSTLNLWVGTYTPGNEPGGLWSLTVAGADSASPANSGKATKTIQLQDRIPTASYTFTSGILLTSAAVTFNGTASFDPDGTIVSYAWVFGDGSTGTGATPSHSYSVAGNYVVKLNVTDNSGSTAVSTQTITIMDKASSNVSLPLYYFGILAALIAALLIGAFLALRRHKVTHARLKIDLEAVKAEAGRIENQEFFQSVKDQLKKDKE
jgi:PKD repeat protein